jgi:hypothetical protein
MAIQPKTERQIRFLDKEELQRLVAELHQKLGVEPDPAMTIERLREMMLADGVRPEENAASRELIKMRYGEEAIE